MHSKSLNTRFLLFLATLTLTPLSALLSRYRRPRAAEFAETLAETFFLALRTAFWERFCFCCARNLSAGVRRLRTAEAAAAATAGAPSWPGVAPIQAGRAGARGFFPFVGAVSTLVRPIAPPDEAEALAIVALVLRCRLRGASSSWVAFDRAPRGRLPTVGDSLALP